MFTVKPPVPVPQCRTTLVARAWHLHSVNGSLTKYLLLLAPVNVRITSFKWGRDRAAVVDKYQFALCALEFQTVISMIESQLR